MLLIPSLATSQPPKLGAEGWPESTPPVAPDPAPTLLPPRVMDSSPLAKLPAAPERPSGAVGGGAAGLIWEAHHSPVVPGGGNGGRAAA
mmetsp:Transcript_49746/g.85535  ORF Transcript_49746/g.85535 Transcript_49746/m.85535 type:complete len:89 (+) Transcript_49746:690-956(+)